MWQLKTGFVSLLLVVAGCAAVVRSYAKLPADWKIAAPPVNALNLARCVTSARERYEVALSRDSSILIISPDSALRRRADTLKVDGGRLIGFDGGEFGGRISWQPDSGGEQGVASVNPHALIQLRDTVWALTGLAHLTSNKGQLIRLDRVGTGWRVGETIDLGAAPEAIVRLPGDTLLVLAVGRLISISPSHRVEVLHENRMWIYTYPTNLIRDRAGAVYLGMMSGVARLTPKQGSYKEQWLLPNICDTARP
jgi:hypothetical protein